MSNPVTLANLAARRKALAGDCYETLTDPNAGPHVPFRMLDTIDAALVQAQRDLCEVLEALRSEIQAEVNVLEKRREVFADRASPIRIDALRWVLALLDRALEARDDA